MDFGITHLALHDYRNYERLDLDLREGFTLVTGPNAHGKTNLLEAIYLLASTRLLRGQRDAEGIREGASGFRVEGVLATGTVVTASLERGGRKRFALNGASLPRAADALGRLPCVCVSAADLRLVRGEPVDRRLFLDLELSALYASYLRDLAVYKRALEQRNALLKAAQEAPVASETFGPWEEAMAHRGAALRATRRKYLEELGPQAADLHGVLGGGESLGLTIEPKDEARTEDELRELFESRRRDEIARGLTLFGPQRDDVRIAVGGRDARLYGSQGQQRSAVIAIKMATLLQAKAVLGAVPLLLLDDILSDLDAGRRERLTEIVLAHADQAILTCTEPEAAGPEILRRANILAVREG
ncbi:DNA replication and repair protein RecF, partial [bacterium]